MNLKEVNKFSLNLKSGSKILTEFGSRVKYSLSLRAWRNYSLNLKTGSKIHCESERSEKIFIEAESKESENLHQPVFKTVYI